MRWISQNTRPHETVIADAEPLVYLFTDTALDASRRVHRRRIRDAS